MSNVTDWLRAIGIPVMIFVLLFLAVQFGLQRWTSEPTMIRPELITQIAEQVDSSAIGGDSIEATPEEGSPIEGPLNTHLNNIFRGLNAWAFWVFATGLLLSIAWAVFALWRQANSFGPSAQASAWPAWAVGALAYVSSAVAIFFWFVAPEGLAGVMTDISYRGAIAIIALIGFLAYWLATALAASPVMKPSVPLGVTAP